MLIGACNLLLCPCPAVRTPFVIRHALKREEARKRSEKEGTDQAVAEHRLQVSSVYEDEVDHGDGDGEAVPLLMTFKL